MTLIEEGHTTSGIVIPAEPVILVVQPAPLILLYVSVVDQALHFAITCLPATDELTFEMRLLHQVFLLAMAMLPTVLKFTFVEQ